MMLIYVLFIQYVFSLCESGDCVQFLRSCGTANFETAKICYNDTWVLCPIGATCKICNKSSNYYTRSQHYPVRTHEVFTTHQMWKLPNISSYKLNSFGIPYSNEIYIGQDSSCFDGCGCSNFQIDGKLNVNQMDFLLINFGEYDYTTYNVIWPALGLNLDNEPWIIIKLRIRYSSDKNRYCCMKNISSVMGLCCGSQHECDCLNNDTLINNSSNDNTNVSVNKTTVVIINKTINIPTKYDLSSVYLLLPLSMLLLMPISLLLMVMFTKLYTNTNMENIILD